MKTVVVLSGGLDSSTLAYYLVDQGRELFAVSIDYGQRHSRELEAASSVAKALSIPWERIDLSTLGRALGSHNALTGSVAVPDGHYAEESMKATVVPNRNMILIAVAVGVAIDHQCDSVAYGAHAGDHTIYPDCRPEFAEALGQAVALCDWHPIALERPFVDKTKADVVRLGMELGVPFELTWSCYKGGELHCGTCGTCTERREAFQLIGVADPTRYA